MPTAISSASLALKLMHTLPAMGHAMARSVRSVQDVDANVIIQMRMLHSLIEGPRSFKDLCAYRGVSAPTLSRSLRALERHGWIERVTHPEDKRQLLLQVTPRGRIRFDTLHTAAQRYLEARLNSLNVAQRRTVSEALDLLQTSLLS
jgi:DNA-binding MarR family transcriptional regulator